MRSIRIPRGLAAPCSLLALAAAAPAQIGPPGAEWPSTLNSGSFGPAAAGRFVDDDPSLVVCRGDDLYYVHSPAVFEAVSVVDTVSSYTDVAREPGGGIGGRDAVLGSTGSGLVRVAFDPSPPSTFVVQVLDSSSALTSCRRLICFQSMTGGLRVAALSSDGSTVTVLERQGNGSYSEIESFALLNTTTTDLVAANWMFPTDEVETDPTETWEDELEFVTAANNGITIYAADGTAKSLARSDLPGSRIARVRAVPPATLDHVAWLAHRPAGWAFYLVNSEVTQSGPDDTVWDLRARTDPTVEPTDPETELYTLTTVVTPIHLVAGDFDGDGDDDLAVTMETYGRVLGLRNDHDGTRFFQPEEVFEPELVSHTDLTEDPGGDSSDNRGRPVVGTFAGGSIVGLAAAIDDDSFVRIVPKVFPPGIPVEVLADVQGYVDTTWFEVDPADLTDAPGYLYLELTDLPTAEYLEDRRIHVVVYRKESPDDTLHLVEPVAKLNRLYELAMDGAVPASTQVLEILLPPETYQGEACTWLGTSPVHYFVAYRFVEWDGTSMSNGSRRWIVGHTAPIDADDCETDEEHHLDYMNGLIGASGDEYERETRSALDDCVPSTTTTLPGSDYFGTIVIQAELPPMGTTATPVSPPLDTTWTATSAICDWFPEEE